MGWSTHPGWGFHFRNIVRCFTRGQNISWLGIAISGTAKAKILKGWFCHFWKGEQVFETNFYQNTFSFLFVTSRSFIFIICSTKMATMTSCENALPCERSFWSIFLADQNYPMPCEHNHKMDNNPNGGKLTVVK